MIVKFQRKKNWTILIKKNQNIILFEEIDEKVEIYDYMEIDDDWEKIKTLEYENIVENYIDDKLSEPVVSIKFIHTPKLFHKII